VAWTAPKTFTASSALTASELNTHLTANLTWLKDALAVIGQDSDSVAQVLQSARYGCSAYRSGVSVGDATDVAIQFETSDEVWDDAAFHDGVNKARFKAPTAGTYEVKAWAQFAANGTGRREIWFEVNGSDEYNRLRIPTTGSAASTNIFTACEIELSANDYVVMRARQSSGSTLDVNARFSIRRIAV
jgi:hypothetical protein